MSDAKTLRTLEEIQMEYQQLCTKAGHLQYQLHTITSDLSVVNSTLRDLNIEAATVHKASQELLKAAEAANEAGA